MNCNGCGTEIDPTREQLNASVDQILATSLKDAEKRGGVCPLCGHSKAVPYSHRKTVLFGLLLACFVLLAGIYKSRLTERKAVANEAIARMVANADAVRFIGLPISVQPGLQGEIKQDETGWKEAKLTIPVRGPNGEATAHVVGNRGTGAWVFTTFEVIIEKQHKKVDLVSGRVVEYYPNAYVEVHTQSAVVPEYVNTVAAAARLTGEYPCVFASVGGNSTAPQLGNCSMPTMQVGPVDRFEVDLRYGRFVLRQTDLYLADVFDVPLTRSYNSMDWGHPNPVHAFGRNSNHPYDIAPLGSRNPYTYVMIDLEDGDFLYFDRVSTGTGYADAVYQHTETSTRFYRATFGWNGEGWTTTLADGSTIRFPESYNAKNMAQGAPSEMRDSKGNRLELDRDSQRDLQQIKTPHGHWMKFKYDDASRIVRVEDDAGKWVRYNYNTDGMLVDAVFSSGQERHYAYDKELMTKIMNEKGVVLLQNWYDSEKMLQRQKFQNGASYSYSYEWAASDRNLESVEVTLPNGTTKTVQVADFVPNYVRNYHQ